jgi:hypothetical protein
MSGVPSNANVHSLRCIELMQVQICACCFIFLFPFLIF